MVSQRVHGRIIYYPKDSCSISPPSWEMGAFSWWYEIHKHLRRTILHQPVWLLYFSLLGQQKPHQKTWSAYCGKTLYRRLRELLVLNDVSTQNYWVINVDWQKQYPIKNNKTPILVPFLKLQRKIKTISLLAKIPQPQNKIDKNFKEFETEMEELKTLQELQNTNICSLKNVQSGSTSSTYSFGSCSFGGDITISGVLCDQAEICVETSLSTRSSLNRL